MRIGIVCPYSLDVPGGVQHHVTELAAALLAMGQEVSVLAPADDGAALPAYVVPAGRAVRVPYNGSVARLAFGPASVARARRWLADGDLDVLHVHEPTAPSLSLLALQAAEVPVVATFHTAMENSSRAMAVVGPVLRPALERIGARIAVSEHALATMRRHVGGSGVVIPNGLWVERFGTARTTAPGRARAVGGTVAFLGRTGEPRKGLDVLLRAWPAVAHGRPGVRLLVAGHGDADRARAQVRSVMSASSASSVEVLGAIDGRTRERVLAAADVFVAPHTGGESFGVVLLEAMAAGAAVLASDLPAFDAVLDSGRLGRLFPTGDVGVLGTALGQLLDDPGLREQLTRRATVAVRAYDWPVVARRVLRVHETVVAGGRVAVTRAGGASGC